MVSLLDLEDAIIETKQLANLILLISAHSSDGTDSLDNYTDSLCFVATAAIANGNTLEKIFNRLYKELKS